MKKIPSKQELEELRLNLTREEVANKYGVSISTVRRWVQKYKLQRKKRFVPKEIRPANLDWGVSVIDKAKMKLGSRLVETRDGYRLDGRPVNTDDILQAAGIKSN